VTPSRAPWDTGDLAGTKLFMANLIDPNSGYVERQNTVRLITLRLIESTHREPALTPEQKSQVTLTVLTASNEVISDLTH